jgi:hypothetical protein
VEAAVVVAAAGKLALVAAAVGAAADKGKDKIRAVTEKSSYERKLPAHSESCFDPQRPALRRLQSISCR